MNSVIEIKVGPGTPSDHHVSIVGGKCENLNASPTHTHVYVLKLVFTF